MFDTSRFSVVYFVLVVVLISLSDSHTYVCGFVGILLLINSVVYVITMHECVSVF